MRANFPFFSSSQERGDRLAHDIETLAVLADTGRCLAAKDVSMAGLLGSLAMLLEPTGCGATVVLDKVPRPPGVPLNRWVQAFPQFSFLLCAPPAAVPACRQAFAEPARSHLRRKLVTSTEAGELKLQLGSRRHMLLDLSADPVTGLRREPALTPPGKPARCQSRITNQRDKVPQEFSALRRPGSGRRGVLATLSLTQIVQGVR